MSETFWPEPVATTAAEAGVQLVGQLWVTAHRVDAALSESRLAALARLAPGEQGPQSVSIVTAKRSTTDPSRRLLLPDAWLLTEVQDAPVPEFMLFYPRGSSFPDGAVLFAGGSGSHGWITYHRRPLVLHRLRDRFNRLSSSTRDQAVAASVREETLETQALESLKAADSMIQATDVSQRRLYESILAAHFAGLDEGRVPARRPNAAPTLAAHQERAYERACHILDRYGGVIIADSVGLGKTYIGLRLIERTLEAGGDALVVVPAALKFQWTRELSYLQTYTDASQDHPEPPCQEDSLDFWVHETSSGRVSVLSMESLGRRTFGAVKYTGADLVLVDEAHNFRNPETRRYRNLADLVRHSNVVLLTATPINNTLLDLQHLIDLFAAPGAFRHLGINDHRDLFRRAALGEGDVRGIVAACVLRRTRRFLRAHYGQTSIQDPLTRHDIQLRFPTRTPPVSVDYDLAGTYGDLFVGLEDWLGALLFPSIDPHHERAEIGTRFASTSSLLKIILLKRLESSIEAFRRTVIQQLAWCNTALRAIASKRVLTRPDYRAVFQGPDDDPGSQLAFFELMLPVPSIEAHRVEQFRNQLDSDKQILAHIHSTLKSVGSDGDRKLQKLIELLDGELSGRKILIFTEFRDTARYIHHALRNRPRVAQIDSEVARLGLERASRRDVIERFAPKSNGKREPPIRERVDVLIATDVLSEGLNLQDASVVVSYDLPWNPVRLMQRIGRIDRLGAIHECVALYHFVPNAILDRLLGLMALLQGKVATIQATLGLDRPVLLEPPEGHSDVEQVRILARDPDGYDKVEQELEGPFDPEEQAYLDFVDSLKSGRVPAASSPNTCVIMDRQGNRVRAVAYWRVACGSRSRGLWLICDPESGLVLEDQVAAIEALRAASAAKRPHDRYPYEHLVASARVACARFARGVLARYAAARIAGDALRPGLPQCQIAAWLSRSLKSSPQRLAPEVRAAADRLLDRLARRFTTAGEHELARFARSLPAEPDSDIVIELEATLRSLERGSHETEELREVGLLLIIPPE